MELSGPPQAADDRLRQLTVALRPGACTIIDWASSTAAQELNDDDQDNASASDSDASEEGYTSNAGQVPPAIANDPFFAQILRRAEMRDAEEKRRLKKRGGKRRVKEAADDMYDLDDPFIDDSELTVMDGHNYAQQQQRKKRRKREDGSNTETEGVGATDLENGADKASEDKVAGADESGIPTLEDLDRYEEDDFFVYYGPLNELGDADEEDTPAAPKKSARARKRSEKKQGAKDAAGKKKPSAAVSKGDASDTAAKKKNDSKAQQHRRSASDADAGSSNGPQVPTNGRKAGARTSRKLDQGKSASSASDEPKPKLPPVPDRDKPANGGSKKPEDPARASEPAALPQENAGKEEKAASKRANSAVSGAAVSSTVISADDSKALAEARRTTPEIEAALSELKQATQNEEFTNRQRFPSSLKPALRQVCELSMARALEYDREILSLQSTEHKVFAWTTPLDIVGFTSNIYNRLAAILPYNRATVRKIVSKLLGRDLLTWKEQQLKQIEEGLKARVDEQIERNMGWIPVAPKAGAKEEDPSGNGGSQVRWHWTTLSKHILYQYMVLTLNINELRNNLDSNWSKDGGGYREQQARKDAYAHLVNLWPGNSMSTYEISRAYSSRKSLLEKQSKRADSGSAANSQNVSHKKQEPPAASSEKTSMSKTPPEPTPTTQTPVPDMLQAHAASSSTVLPISAAMQQPISPGIPIDYVSSPPRPEHIHRSPYFEFSQSPNNRLSEISYAGHLPSPSQPPPAHSHRPLDFAAEQPHQPPMGVPFHGPYLNEQPIQYQQQYQQQQPAPPAEDEYDSNTHYNSMSVRNLTSP
ncbi:hypothetical protein IWW36_000043 [Coemansia brasiliensis]|uniref:Uncharacterized protein n=1 Tax=Coemansia brasiliensis TaxID=2650707 RepID=A0A9W8M1M7_9FUNG|nr:hypothetical protein IWW36_000043 [Coemansia brasiliensis]